MQATFIPTKANFIVNQTYISLTKGFRVKQEYRVYDLNRLIGSIGGSLGLFVGFSFLDLAYFMVQRFKILMGK